MRAQGERQTMSGSQDEVDLCPDVSLETQLSVDKIKSCRCPIKVETGQLLIELELVNGMAAENSIEVWGPEKWKKEKRLMSWWLCCRRLEQQRGQMFQGVRKSVSGRKNNNEGFAGYQRCDLSDISKTIAMNKCLSADWYRTDTHKWCLRLCTTWLLTAVNWMAKPGGWCEPQSSSFSHH